MKRTLHIYFDDEYDDPPFPPKLSEEEVDAVAYVSFMIALHPSASPENYLPELKESVDILAREVAHGLPSLSIILPSLLDGSVESKCPDVVNMNERCEEVTVSIGVFVDDAKTMNDIHLSTSEFEEKLEVAILNQRLQNTLNSIGSDTSLWIVTGTLPPDETDTSNGLSQNTIIVFVACGLFVLLSVLLRFFWCRKSRPVDEKKGAKGKSKKAVEEEGIFDDLGATTPVTSTDIASPGRSAASSAASSADPDVDTRQEYKTPLSTFHATSQSPPISPPSKVLFPDQSSSSDHSNFNVYDSVEALSEDESQALSLDLDEALQNGGWVSGGVIASMISRSPTVLTGRHSRISEEEEAVAELDNLVQAKDWGGQRSNELAVIKEEASPKGVPSSPASKSFGLSRGNSEGSSDSFLSSSVIVDDARAEIEYLVHKVVPEEIENIDHMIAEFEGNEEELLKSLRAMKERLEAKKARLLGRKEAKKKALQTVKAKKQEAQRYAGVSLSSNAYWVNEDDNTEVMEV